MKVSVFKNIRQTDNPTQVDLSKILDAIKSGKIKDLVLDIQNEQSKKRRQELKKKLPCVLFSGTFNKRADDEMIEHSGIICLDFDDFNDFDELVRYRSEIALDKYVYSIFVSPSGLGLKVLVKVPPSKEDHRAYFLALEEHFNSENFDSTCKNESRVCYMSYDAEMYINEDSEVFKEKKEVKEYEQPKTPIKDIKIHDSSEIIDGLYKWWESKFGLVEGERNLNTYILAMAFNEYGIPELEARQFLSQFEHGDFKMDEINTSIKSAYSNTHLHGTKQFQDPEEYYDDVLHNENRSDKKKINYPEIYKSAFVDVNKKIEHPPTAISVGTHTVSGNVYPTDFATYGNFSCLVGASKSRKTFFKSMITAAYIGGNTNKYASSIKTHRETDTFVLDIDTEQSPFHSQKVFQRTLKMVGNNSYEYYKPFALRPYEPKERLQFLEWLIYESDFKENIGLVCVDGLADLVNDFNDLKESQKVVQKVMKWTDEKQFHLTTILHSNFGSSKAVGHIGSSVLKKAETVCTIKSSDGITNVDFTHTRGYPIDELNFTVNKDGIPVLLGDESNDDLEMKDEIPLPKVTTDEAF